MISIKSDNAGQLITVEYSAHVTAAEIAESEPQFREALAEMRPGFRLLVDFTSMAVMDPTCGPVIAQIMDLCSQAGVGHVHRVIPDPHKDIGVNILSYFHYDRQVVIATYETLAEAQKGLAA